MVTLNELFGRELRAVCFVDDFLFEPRFIENTPAQLDAGAILDQIRDDWSDSDHMNIYLVDLTGRVSDRFRVHQLAPFAQVYVVDGAGCRAASSSVSILRQRGGRIVVTIELAVGE